MKNVLNMLALTAVLGSSVASATNLSDPGLRHVGASYPLTSDIDAIERLDPIAMEATRAGLVPLALALSIGGIDLALMGFFWGVYVPYYAPQEPAAEYTIE